MALIINGSTFSGSYNNLSDTPTIPTNTNQLTNGAGFITSAPAPTTSQVLSATAGLSAGAVGSYGMVASSSWSTRTAGTTISGSDFKWSAASGWYQGNAISGTWRILGENSGSSNQGNNTTLCVRIS